MLYGVHENHGNYAIARQLALASGRQEHVRVTGVSKKEAAGLRAAGVPFFHGSGRDLPEARPLMPMVIANDRRQSPDEPEWVLMIGERRAAALTLAEAQMMEHDGLVVLDQSGHSPERIRRENVLLTLEGLKRDLAETQARIAEEERRLAALDEEPGSGMGP